MANQKKLISIIVPCFNEEEVLPIFYKEFTKVAKAFKQNYELILVDDGSKDKTIEVMESLARKDKHVLYISFSRNFGKEAAMFAGLNNAKGDYVGFIDADLQHPPVLIKQMIERLDTGEYDCVACRRIDRTGDSKIRTWFARRFYEIENRISNVEMVDGAGDYRLMTKKMVNAILAMPEYNRFSKGIFSWVGFKTYWIDYENVSRAAGTTSWSFIKLVKYALNGFVSFSSFLLYLPIWMSVLFGIISIVMIISSITNSNNQLAIIGIILLISTFQLLSIGIIGQYVGKTHIESKNRPHYIISKTNKKDSIDIK